MSKTKKKILTMLKKMVDVLDVEIGDTDPDVGGLTEDEIIEYEPNYWLMHRVIELQQEVKKLN